MRNKVQRFVGMFSLVAATYVLPVQSLEAQDASPHLKKLPETSLDMQAKAAPSVDSVGHVATQAGRESFLETLGADGKKAYNALDKFNRAGAYKVGTLRIIVDSISYLGASKFEIHSRTRDVDNPNQTRFTRQVVKANWNSPDTVIEVSSFSVQQSQEEFNDNSPIPMPVDPGGDGAFVLAYKVIN